MPESPASSTEASFRACVSEAARRGAHLMDKLVEAARASMPQRAGMAHDAAEREQVTQALNLLLMHRNQLTGAFPDALLAEFARALSSQAPKASTASLSFDALELMGDDQVQESVEVLRAQQATQQAVESVMGEFNALICAAQGLKTVQGDRNPLRPEIYVRALRAVIGDIGIPGPMRLRWMQHLGEALGPLLAQDYTSLCRMLRSGGVAAAGFNIINDAPVIPSAPSARGAGAQVVVHVHADGSPADPASLMAAPGQSHPAQTLLTVKQLRRLLSGELDAGKDNFDARFAREFETGGREFPADFSPTVPAAFEALQEMQQVDQVMKRLAERKGAQVSAPAGSTAALREQLRSEASTGQALGLEVVNLMVDNIAHDARLLPEVQQVVRELEPALLRLALIDPRFFSDKRHPARSLLEQITQRSLAWPTADAAGFAAFMEPARQAVQALLTTHIAGAEPFDFALKSLEEVWDEQQKHERRKREKAVRVLVQAEQRNMLAEKIATGLRDRAQTAGAQRGIVYFVAGPWAQVIAQARLADLSGQPDPCGYEDLVTDLLWSSIPEVASSNPARLTRLIPGLLAKLREGLESVGYSRSKSGRFFEELMALHARAIQPGETAGGAPSSARARLEAQFRDADAAPGLWMAPSEAHQSGFLETQTPSALPKPLFEETQPAFGETQLDAHMQPHMQTQTQPQAMEPAHVELSPGAWVELHMDDAWVRTQLTWGSPHGTLFMFTNAQGVNHSMTRQSLDRLAAAGHLRVLASQAVVEGALDAVAQAALRNSVDFTL